MNAEELFHEACDLESVDAEQARTLYERALWLNPEHLDARLNLGCLLHELGLLRAAEAHYRAVLHRVPEHPTATFNLAVALEDQGRTAEAADLYSRAATAEPPVVDAHFNLARLLELRGEVQAAFRHLRQYQQLALAPSA